MWISNSPYFSCDRRYHKIVGKVIERKCMEKVVYHYIWLSLLGFISFMGLSFTANPFGSRIASLFIRLSFGISINQVKHFRLTRAHRGQ